MAVLPITIDQLIAQRIPAGFVFPENYQQSLKQKWQLILAQNLNPIPIDDDATTDGVWSYNYMVLIAALVVYDMMIDIATQAAMSGLTIAANGQGGEIRKITTGPDDVEFVATSQAFVSFFKPSGSGETSLDFLKYEACGIASVLRVRILACGPYKSPVIQLQNSALLDVNDPNYILNLFTPAVTSGLYSVGTFGYGFYPIDQGGYNPIDAPAPTPFT